MTELTANEITQFSKPIILPDPSEYRPEYKNKDEYRNFRVHSTPQKVVSIYENMHTYQTLEFARKKVEEWGKLNRAEMTVMEAVEALTELVDESDPDVDFPNFFHAFQTAEGIRKVHPQNEWLQVTGFIHDIGKIMWLWGEPQWCVVGDTFPVGCKPADSIVFGPPSFKENPDIKNEKINTKLGIYEENCGLENVVMSWGHDEYLYHVLKGNECHLPVEALYIVRFHSFYPWHTCGDYMHLCSNKDVEMLEWVKEFNQFDLYTKSADLPNVAELFSYYQKLIEKYIPGKLRW